MSTESLRATCADCGKSYRVPAAGRAYTCKACGGSVRVEAASTDSSACVECGAGLEAGDDFCSECGASQSGADAGERRKSQRAEDRRQASSEIARAIKSVKFVRWVFGLGAVGYGLMTLELILGLAVLPESGPQTLLWIAIATLLFIMHVVGVMQVRSQPFAWSMVIASLSSVALALQLVQGGLPPLALILRIGFTVVLWLQVMPCARARKLIAAHPDLYVAHRLQGTQLSRHSARGSAQQSRALFASAARRSTLRSAVVAAAIALTASLSTWGVWAKGRPAELPPIDPSIQVLVEAWLQRDVDGLAALYPEDKRASAATSIGRVVERRAWGEDWPHLGQASLRIRGEAGADVTFEVGIDELVTRWRLNEQAGWQLISLNLPD